MTLYYYYNGYLYSIQTKRINKAERNNPINFQKDISFH